MESHPAFVHAGRRPSASRRVRASFSVLVAATALVTGIAFAASDRRAIDLSGVQAVDATTVNGRIVVSVDPAAPGVIVDHRGNVEYDVTVQGGTLRLVGRNRSHVCVNCEVSFDVRLPGAAALSLRTTNGHVQVTGTMLRVDAATTNGDVTTRDTGAASLQLRTTNGRVGVTGARGPLDAETTNGSIDLVDLSLPAGSDSRARTVNGSVTARGLAAGAALTISGHVQNGGIRVSLTGFSVSYPDKRNFRATSTAASGTYADGTAAASLDLTSVNGSLTVGR